MFTKKNFISYCKGILEELKKYYPDIKFKEKINKGNTDSYFIINEKDNIEIVISFFQSNGGISCNIQKPNISSIIIDNKGIYTGRDILNFIKKELLALTKEQINASIKDPMEKHRGGNIYKSSENYFYVKENNFYFFYLDGTFEKKIEIC